MDALMALVALAALFTLGALVWRTRRSRSDQRLQWQGTRDRDWTTDELAELSATEAGTDAFTTDVAELSATEASTDVFATDGLVADGFVTDAVA